MNGHALAADVSAALRHLKPLSAKAIGMACDAAVVLASVGGRPVLRAGDGAVEVVLRLDGEWGGDPIWLAYEGLAGVARAPGKLNLELKGGRLSIHAGALRAKLATAPYDGTITWSVGVLDATLPAQDLYGILSAAAGLVEDNEYRPLVSAVRLQAGGGAALARATDGAAAMEVRRACAAEIPLTVVPATTIWLLQGWLRGRAGDVSVRANERQLEVLTPDAYIRSAASLAPEFQLDALWPVGDVIGRWSGDPLALKEAVTTVARVAPGRPVGLVLSGSTITVKTPAGADEADVEVPGAEHGVTGGVETYVDPKRLQVLLSAHAGPESPVLEVVGAGRGFVTLCSSSVRAVLCPVRLPYT